ncbi:CD209 antigen-like isoform X1 [Fundulus heteroclitus]|uniref:CD209 antigen-like isoform X1 n=1 Tax=Fundulus heteroclitus TaxID=8078 RepID=UPI00165A77E1|nr:CD209 antigen-like isoform X1 [Fundulus heteroclitus]
MSSEGKIYQDLTTDEGSHSHRRIFGQGLFAEIGGNTFQHHRLVILSLGLLNAALLISAAVIGIYCANAKDLQIPGLAASPLLVEVNFLRNHTELIRDKLETQNRLKKERANHVQMKLEVRQKKTLTDSLQRTISMLQTEKTHLQSNRSAFENNCARCPAGWLLLKTSCYYFSKHEPASRKNWTDSRADCVRQGGDLLVINNLEEQLLMSSNFPRIASSSSWWMNGLWIGLTDVQHPGTWTWTNNVTETSTMYWRNGQPSRNGTQSGNCVAFHYYGDNLKTWYTGNCQEHLLNWICEMRPSNQ